MNIFKKVGSILFCFLPFLLTLGIQFFVMFAGIFFMTFKNMLTNPELGLDVSELVDQTMSLATDSSFIVGVSAVYAIINIIIFAIWYRFSLKDKSKRQITDILNPTIIISVVILSISLQYLCSYLINALAYIMPSWMDQYQSVIENLGLAESTSLLSIIYAILIAPISEELIFRGVILQYGKRAMNFWVANIFQAVLFGVLHMNFIQGTYAFVIGLVFGYIAHKGNSLWLVILFHMLFNLLGVFLPEFMHFPNSSVWLHIIIFIVSAVTAVVGIKLFQKGNGRKLTS